MSNLLKDNIELMKEYDFEKNKDIDLGNITLGSNKKIWWICHKGHSYDATVNNRNNKRNCPYCANKKILVGYNDLATTNPVLLEEWNYKKNVIKPTEVTDSMSKKVWWTCSKGHEWLSRIDNRKRGKGCPYCSNKKILVGYNDLATTNPELILEWNYEKNKNINIESVTISSSKIVWWKCSKGHEWEAAIYTRTSGHGCPICSSELRTSFPEKAIYFYLKRYFIDALENYKSKMISGKELDIFIPSQNVAVEYDGEFWHNDIKRDLDKDRICFENGIKLIRFREPNCKKIKSSSIIIKLNNKSLEELELKIEYLLFTQFGIRADVDINRDLEKINNLMNYQEKGKSLEEKYPNISLEWNYEKNCNLLPSQVKYGSSKKVWWKCKKGHEWQTSILNRTVNKHGCPLCNGGVSRKVYQYDLNNKLIKVYQSVSAAEKETGISHSNIVMCCCKKRNKAGNYIWSYNNLKD